MSQTNGKPRFPPQAVAGDVGQFAPDVVTLAELQVELVKVEADDYAKRIAKPLIAIVGGIIVFLGSVPVALTALAYGLVQAGFDTWFAFLISTGVGLLTAAGFAVIGWQTFRRANRAFSRSKQEWHNNVKWLKGVLKREPRRPAISA